MREALVEQGLMNPDGPMKLEDSVVPYPICTEMCPEYERVRRIVEMDYKAAECTPETAHGPRADRVPDESRMVKAFTRSAAGAEEELVTEKRTAATCLVSTFPNCKCCLNVCRNPWITCSGGSTRTEWNSSFSGYGIEHVACEEIWDIKSSPRTKPFDILA
jgi:hypothetical protein